MSDSSTRKKNVANTESYAIAVLFPFLCCITLKTITNQRSVPPKEDEEGEEIKSIYKKIQRIMLDHTPVHDQHVEIVQL